MEAIAVTNMLACSFAFSFFFFLSLPFWQKCKVTVRRSCLVCKVHSIGCEMEGRGLSLWENRMES